MNQKNTTPTTATKPNNTPASTQAELAKAEEKKPMTVKFAEMVDRNFAMASGAEVSLTPVQMRLVQHLAMSIERGLAAAEIKREQQGRGNGDWAEKARNAPSFTWANVNLEQLKIDALLVVQMELDAAIPNHVFPIPRLNGRTGKYDIGLQPGYVGKMHCARKFAVNEPLDVVCKLVFEGDDFDIATNDLGGEEPVHKTANFFKPADELPIGGFYWLKYRDRSMNRVVVVDAYEFAKAEKAAQSDAFWGGEVQETKWNPQTKRKEDVGEPYYDPKVRRDMMLKTVWIRAAKAIQLDPSKLNADVMIFMEAPELDAAALEMRNERHEHQGTEDLNIPPAAPLPEPKADPATGEVVEDEFAEVEDEKKVSGPAQEEL